MKTKRVERAIKTFVALTAAASLAACNNGGGGSRDANTNANQRSLNRTNMPAGLTPQQQQQMQQGGQGQPGQFGGPQQRGVQQPGLPRPAQGQLPMQPQGQPMQAGRGLKIPAVEVRPIPGEGSESSGAGTGPSVVSATTTIISPAGAQGAQSTKPIAFIGADQTGEGQGRSAGRTTSIGSSGYIGAGETGSRSGYGSSIRITNIDPREVSGQGVAGTQGSGWPGAKPFSLEPLRTGARDRDGEAFTDSKDDSIMAVLVKKMNELPEHIRQASFELADVVQAVDLEVRGTEAALDVTFLNEGKPVQVMFRGQVGDARRAGLMQIAQAADGGFKFAARVACMDADKRFCRQGVISLDQLQNDVVCRRIFIVHRHMKDGIGDGHITLSDEDYYNWARIKHPTHRAFARIISNTAHATKVILGEIPKERLRSPRLEYIGIRSWAVAYGPAFFEASFSKADGNLGTRGDTTQISGPLKMQMRNVQPLMISGPIGGYRNAQVDAQFDEKFAQPATRATLLENDGRGDLTVKFDFKSEVYEDGAQATSTRVNFSSMRLDVVDRATMEQLIQ